ncbi:MULTISPECIES: DUF2273 domain-containing protein [Parafrankia]|uniref:DUF2273 domain-containing protein n=1 Tax=Parafrankia colletiae TaxID=573497 RepID=A0A1S1QB92_9ACTN|nr:MULTISPECIES: hypothetical protein [Parafrankia]MCK9900307.1 hypothetical protein [Frankia sp. Cpl3]OHV30485.1 hypothetical protein CC117_05915 [Parafrankia colletiae]
MRWGPLGLVAGLVAGLALAFGGFGEFLIVLLFGAIGLFVGKIVDGDIELGRSDRDGFAGMRRRRRP